MVFAQGSAMNWTLDNNSKTEGNVDIENAIDRDENLAKIEIATLAIIFLVTVLGNGTVLLALWTRRRYAGRKKLSRMYFFILHLSIADLITAFLSVLPQLGWEVTYRFNGGFVLCKLVKYGQTLGPYLSSYVLMATAIDRHQAICYPLTYCSWTSRRSKVMVWLAWATSLAFCTPQVHSYEPSDGTNSEGHIYEDKLAALFALRLCNLSKDFNLLINAKHFNRWDDIVLVLEVNGIKKVYCLQLKHVTGKSNAVLRADMFEAPQGKSKTKTLCDLKKLSEGYQIIKKNLTEGALKEPFENVDVNNIQLVLFTNISGKLIMDDKPTDEYIDLLETAHEKEEQTDNGSDQNEEDDEQEQMDEDQEEGTEIQANNDSVVDVKMLTKRGGTPEEWEEFFGHFFYFGNQVGQNQLNPLIKKEIIKFLNVDDAAISSKAINTFLNYVKLWSNGKLAGYHTLTKTHIRSILVDILMLNLQVMTPPDDCSEDIETGHEEWNTIVSGKSLIVLQHIDDELLRFIFVYAMRQQRIFENSTLYKILRNEAVDVKPLAELLTSNNFNLQCYISKDYDADQQFTMNFTILLFKLGLIPLVIKARSYKDIELACKILEITKAENTKLVLVSEDMQNSFIDNNIANSFMYLNDVDSQNMPALYKKRINIHGREYKLKQLIDDTCPTLKSKLTSDNILKILIKDCQIGQIFEQKANHIERKIPAIRLNPEVLKIMSDIFVVYGENATMHNLELIPNVSTSGCIEHDVEHKVNEEALERCRIFLLKNADKGRCYKIYEQVCALTEKNVHLIKLHIFGDGTFLQWIRTRGMTKVVGNNRMASESFHKEGIESIMGNVNILSADPGYGKTTVMRQLAEKQVGYLVVFITLVDHAQYFASIDAEDHIKHLKYFFTFALSDTHLDLNIFDAFLTEGKVLVIMDGMDEISKEHKDSVLRFIKKITTLGIKIWITCRVCVQEEVESKLNTLAFRLVGFNRTEQQRYLTQSSTTEIKVKFILNAEQELHEIPLYLFMATKSPFGCSDILSLCENFIQTEISKCYAKKNLAADCAEYFSKKLEEFLEDYALSEVFPSSDLRGIIRQDSFDFELNFYIDAKYTSFGLIRRSNDRCTFTHKAICDYIAAKALVKCKNHDRLSRFATTLFDEKLDSVRFIFHKLNIKAESNSDLKSAIIDKNYDMVAECLENHYIEDIHQDYTTSLHLAAQWGTRHYFPSETNIDAVDESACRKANESGMEKIVELLLCNRKLKKLIFQKDKLLSWTPINYADHSKSLSIFDQFAKIDTFDLNSSEMLTNASKSLLLYLCIRYHYYNLFDILCDHHDINWELECSGSGNSFLHSACFYGNTYVLDFLLKKLPIGRLNKKGETPLHVAAYGFKHVVSLLISKSPPLEAIDNEGYTPLHRAVRCGQREIAELLIRCGADVTTTSFEGYSLLHTASYIDQAQLLDLLIRRGADCNVTDNNGNLPLHTAIEWNSINCVKILAQKTDDINSSNKSGRTLLDLAVQKEQLDIVRRLTSRGATLLTLDIHSEIPDSIRTYLEPLIKHHQPKDFISRSGTVTLDHDFEIKMIALLSLRCCESTIEEILILTDVEECGLFSDIFVHINSEKNGGISYVIQLKHQDDPKNITVSEFQNPKGNYCLTEYAVEMKNVMSHLETKKSNVIYNLRQSKKVVFVLFTNRALSDDTFTFLENIDQQPLLLSMLETGGLIYKLNFCDQSATDSNHMYLFTKQASGSQIDALLRDTLRKLLPSLQLHSQTLDKTINTYIMIVSKWIKGELGGRHFFTKSFAVNILTDVLLSPYMILHNYDTVSAERETKHTHVSSAVSSMNPLTILNSSENCGSQMCQEIVHQLNKLYVDLPMVMSWTATFSDEMQMAFYKNHHAVKSDLIRMVGYGKRITLLDIYKCTWMLGNLPLVLEVTSLQDFENIKAIHNLSKGRLKLVVINCTNEQLLYEN